MPSKFATKLDGVLHYLFFLSVCREFIADIFTTRFSEESFESLQMRDMILDLQSAIKVERQQSLSWMEKHNKVRDALRLAAAEADEFKDTIDKQGSELSGLKQVWPQAPLDISLFVRT